jgi:Na+/phosphate symporter
METENYGAMENLLDGLRGLLADHYILLNKTSYCILDTDSPFDTSGITILQRLYEQIKNNAQQLNELIKNRLLTSARSMNDILYNTQLKKQVNNLSKVAIIDMLLDDLLRVNNYSENLLKKHNDQLSRDEADALSGINESNKSCSHLLNMFLKEIFNYKVSTAIQALPR